MTLMGQQKVYIQQHWSAQELMTDGFLAYRSAKRVTMVRRVPLETALKTRKTSKNAIITEAECWIAYEVEGVLKEMITSHDRLGRRFSPKPTTAGTNLIGIRHLSRPICGGWAANPITKSLVYGRSS